MVNQPHRSAGQPPAIPDMRDLLAQTYQEFGVGTPPPRIGETDEIDEKPETAAPERDITFKPRPMHFVIAGAALSIIVGAYIAGSVWRQRTAASEPIPTATVPAPTNAVQPTPDAQGRVFTKGAAEAFWAPGGASAGQINFLAQLDRFEARYGNEYVQIKLLDGALVWIRWADTPVNPDVLRQLPDLAPKPTAAPEPTIEPAPIAPVQQAPAAAPAAPAIQCTPIVYQHAAGYIVGDSCRLAAMQQQAPGGQIVAQGQENVDAYTANQQKIAGDSATRVADIARNATATAEYWKSRTPVAKP